MGATDEGGSTAEPRRTPRRTRVRRRFGLFRRRDDGVVAVEFVMLAPMFFLIVFATFEVSLITLAQSSMKTGLSEATRLVRTGQGQCFEDEDIIAAICRTAFMPDCEGGMAITKVRFPTGISGTTVVANQWSQLRPDELVLVRADYDWNVVTPILEPFLGDDEGLRLLTESFAFKNEGFLGATCS